MAFRHPGLSARFFVALLLLLGGLTAVGVVAIRGLDQVQGANDQVYADNYLTAEATGALAVELARVESREPAHRGLARRSRRPRGCAPSCTRS